MRCGHEAGERKKMPEFKGVTCSNVITSENAGMYYTDLEVHVCQDCLEKG